MKDTIITAERKKVEIRTFLICFLLFTILFSDYLFTDNLSIFSYRHFLRQICVN